MSAFFNPFRGLIVVTARIVGPTGYAYAHLALDTGATRTLIHPDKLTHVGYALTAALPQQRTTTGSGTIVAPLITLDQMEALGQQRIGLSVLAHRLPPAVPVDGLLGLDFVRGLELTFDFRTGQITLQ